MLTNPDDIGLRYPKFGRDKDLWTDQIEWEAQQGEPVKQEKAADYPSKASGVDVWFNKGSENMNEKTKKRLKMIMDDCESDARSLDGMPFTGLAVGTVFGQLLAMIKGLAESIQELAANCDRAYDLGHAAGREEAMKEAVLFAVDFHHGATPQVVDNPAGDPWLEEG